MSTRPWPPQDPDGPQRVLVAGAGAIGCTLAARLAAAGHAVDLLARGATLQALQAHGLQLEDLDGHWIAPVRPVDAATLAALPPGQAYDLVLLASKSQDLPALAAQLGGAIGPHTLVLPLVNGVPFWYFQGTGGRFEGRRVQAVDPEGTLLARLPAAQLIGSVVFVTAEATAPGRVRSTTPHLLMLGELQPDPEGRLSPRLQALCRLLQDAGIQARGLPRLRDKLWTKLIANLTSNPLSVVTGATLADIYADPVLLETVRSVMFEAMLVAAAHGARLEIDPIEFLRLGAGMGAVRTSMLQDFERGRPLELAAIGDALVELARLYELPMPATQTLLAQTRWHAQRREGALRRRAA
ncbi:ketopantoate reductase family protein [Ideonella livida]|uniref:2-dehydropantoate 2-reductase n=1 Tax=Ideonella livida TaxID=2707176 RepID=A0A7C9PKU7_9BURK|nr:2-dehydropantoate 2-reductase [Ideonella livida]NDY93674.1 2-dehydropantoate 2-reductase [Ideonella livida]